MKRRTRKQWYEYHKMRAQEVERLPVVDRYAPVLEQAEMRVREARAQLKDAELRQPTGAKLAGFLGFSTHYERDVLAPLRAELQARRSELEELNRRKLSECRDADALGSRSYHEAKARRKVEAAEQAKRAEARRVERRLRYLERSPSLRSAARYLKQRLVKAQANEGGVVECFYCGVSILVHHAHIEHKIPISRGGDNRRGNVVLACAPCNLRKGKRTHEEYLRITRSHDGLEDNP